ncbi:methylated-DNA--[protein]-cysteine S-methyltransferase [Rubinisphaera italica]|uniref:methylated-DNA--[protein]-cysteine S-methyltransferase n=1 Tax=Rubinisphaera italica TaxID=2527969 RepID=A0A5C5XEJ4_9PLAN|nr:MGMT family protein [Rubinisphaera italica]TWT61214.1 Methylated-DNA--protein-cysteine methyltransferase [Rubinisphaera italica]
MKTPLYFNAFESELGWCAIAGREETVSRVVIGCETRLQTEEYLQKQLKSQNVSFDIREENWFQECRVALQNYASGEPINLNVFTVDLNHLTRFQQKILRLVQKIPSGHLETYGKIATRSGHPGAARAVGGALSKNPVPLIIPCHRVVGSSGKLTGFTAPQGLTLKQRLLDLEQLAIA